jgi:hypothetical protein
MLPYTTYNIPEEAEDKTIAEGKWLHFFHTDPLSPEQTDLMRKISAALKADFDTDLFCKLVSAGDHFNFVTTPTSRPKLVISFGVDPAQTGYWIDLPAPGIRFLAHCAFILTATLTVLEKNPAIKKALWSDMQTFLEKH